MPDKSFALDEELIDDAVGSVHVSTDYDKFKFDPNNRAVNPAHLRELKASIQENNLLQFEPILVNKEFLIIDGQHRFKAAKQLEIPVYYIMGDQLTMDDAITLNINSKNWGWRDYLDYWINQGNENYILFGEFKERYGFSYSVCLALLGLGQAEAGQKLTDWFNAGKFEAKYQEYAEGVGQKCEELAEYGSFANTRSFVLAFAEVLEMEEFDYDTFLSKVEMAPEKFARRSTKEHYLRMMEDVINYHHRGDRIRLY